MCVFLCFLGVGCSDSNAKKYLTELLTAHVEETGSARAARVLANLDEAMTKMYAVIPAAEKTNPLVASVVASAEAAKKASVGASA